MKSVIYLDVLLLVNFLIAYFFLLAAGWLTGQQAGFGRLLLGAGLSALSALILFAPELPYFWQLLYKTGTAAVSVGSAYGVRYRRRFAAAVVWYAALNMLLAGLALLYTAHTGSVSVQTANLAVYARISPLLLITMSGLCCLALAAVQRLLTPAQAAPATAGLEFTLGDAPLRVRAALDTGCQLQDPMTCLPVLLISHPDARSRLPAEVNAFLEDWLAGQRRHQPPPGTRLRVIPCSTAMGRTLLPGFAVQHMGLITAQGVLELGQAVIAFSPQSFGGNAYEALYGRDFLPPLGRQMPQEEERSPWR